MRHLLTKKNCWQPGYKRGMSCIVALLSFCIPALALAHGVDDNTRQFLENNSGVQIAAFMYIGAKHMVTGYDHLLFLAGVVFLLFRGRDILLYVSLFTLGHSTTLLLGVMANISVNPYLIDAIIGLSVVYKGFDNLGGFRRCFAVQPDTRWAVLVFGLFHGFGLATKLQEFELSGDGMWSNLLAFNIGVEIGQFLALAIILVFINFLRKVPVYGAVTWSSNMLLMSAGLLLVIFQLTAYFAQ